MKRRRLGLRARVITAFAIGALLLSALLSIVTYSLTSANLTDGLHEEAFLNARTNALALNDRLSEETVRTELVELMERLATPQDTIQGMHHGGESRYVNALQVEDDIDALRLSDEEINADFRTLLLAGNATQMTFEIRDEPHYAVGFLVPAARANASYFQAVPLTDLEGTLRSLRLTLLGASAVTTILGLGFGVYVAARIMTPIGDISDAAGLIADGDLSTRLDEETDPDLEQLVHSFNEMTSALEERIERDSRFASDVSHELRSPLMTLTGSVAVLERRREDMPERAQLALDLLSTDIRRFKVLVEDLLEISRFDVGAIQLDIEEVMVGEFVRQAIGAAVGRDNNVSIIHDDHSEEAIVEIDKRRIAQVIRNLCENADKYADGVTQVRLNIDGDDIRIELEDEGPGVPADERELIFERFARGSEGGRRGSGTGVGLGLSLVTEHLRLHKGTIHVTDRVDGLNGARFVISLPDVVVE